MAEYTIPKPYRDFYVTDPLVTLSNDVNCLKKGFEKGQTLSGSTNQNIILTTPAHGFSISNDVSDLLTIDFSDSTLWEQGAIYISSDLVGQNMISTARIRTIDFFPVLANTNYSISRDISLTTNYVFRVVQYDSEKNFISHDAWNNPQPFTTASNAAYIRVVIQIFNYETELTVSGVFSEITSITCSSSDSQTSEKFDVNVQTSSTESDVFIIKGGDTRIITPPKFTSLIISSSVPYHGYLLNLTNE